MLGIWMHLPPQRQAAGSSCCAGKEEEGGKCALKHSQCSNGILCALPMIAPGLELVVKAGLRQEKD